MAVLRDLLLDLMNEDHCWSAAKCAVGCAAAAAAAAAPQSAASIPFAYLDQAAVDAGSNTRHLPAKQVMHFLPLLLKWQRLGLAQAGNGRQTVRTVNNMCPHQ